MPVGISRIFNRLPFIFTNMITQEGIAQITRSVSVVSIMNYEQANASQQTI